MSYWINKKNKKLYKAITTAKNATNKDNYELMMLYKDIQTGEQYVRDFGEFTEKFEPSPVNIIEKGEVE